MTAAKDSSKCKAPCNLETFSLLWLDASVNTSDENIEAQKLLRAAINHLEIFDDDEQCENHIRSLSVHDRIVLIVSGRYGRQIVPRIHSLRQLSAIYVYCQNKNVHQQWAKEFIKINGVFVQLDELITQIQIDQNKRNNNQVDEELSFSIFNSNVAQQRSSTSMNGQFVHYQLLIDCLLRMKSTAGLKDEFVSLCEKEYQGNEDTLKVLSEFKRKYSSKNAIWWYTRNIFLYRILNRALREQNIDVLFLLRFFIHDIHKQLKENQCSSHMSLYRGQLLSIDEFELFKMSKSHLISINSFFSTSIKREIAYGFLSDTVCQEGMVRIVFEITVDSQAENAKPFANVKLLSYFPEEDEVLFMLGSIFKLEDIRRCDDQIWIIRMILCKEGDNELRFVIEEMKTKREYSSLVKSIVSFSSVLYEMGKYDLAEKYLFTLLDDLPDNHEDRKYCYDLLGDLARKKDKLDVGLEWYSKSLSIKRKENKINNVEIGNSHVSISSIYRKKNELDKAIASLNQALEIFQKAYDSEHLDIAACFNSMGYIYLRKNDYKVAMDCFRKALVIDEKLLPINHCTLGIAHNSLADAHRGLHNYEEALKHANIALKIFEKSLPPEHYQIAWTLEIMGNVYEEMGQFSDALRYFQKAAAIYCATLPNAHYYVTNIKQSIERVSSKVN